jgi:peptide-methionine (R)-S-oxide reductase
MASRRQFFVVLGTALGLGPLFAWVSGHRGPSAEDAAKVFPIQRNDDAWRKQLSSAQYGVLREHSTERPYTSPLNQEKRTGTFSCAGCGNALFASATKFESGTGWPSFSSPLPGAVGTSVDRSYLMIRTEVHCAQCGGHLGHVFTDGPAPTGLRYCINGVAMTFTVDA